MYIHMYVHLVWLLYVCMYVCMKFHFIRCSALNKTIFNSNDNNNNGGFHFPKRQKIKIYVGCVTVNVAFVINQFSLHFVIVCNLPLRKSVSHPQTHPHDNNYTCAYISSICKASRRVIYAFWCVLRRGFCCLVAFLARR